MNSYTVHRWTGARPELDGRIFSPDNEPFCALECAKIENYPWASHGYCPEARAYVGRTDEGLLVLMCARETEISAQETEFGGAVYRDSCLEFFLAARPAVRSEYINFEVNANGVAHIAVGAGRANRELLRALPEGMRISHSRHAGEWWAVCYNIPDALICEMLGGAPEREMCANFYKCDESIHPHFGTWNPVTAPKPDFHRPECFGRLILED